MAGKSKFALPDNMQLYKFKAYAAYPTRSANKRNYSKSVLMEAAHKWAGKPFIFDHDAEDSAKTTGVIGEAGYRIDSFPGGQPKEGVWMLGVGAMSKEQFVKVAGIPGKLPAIIKGCSIGAGGRAHPTMGGEEGEVDMDFLNPVELSITPFPGIAQAEVQYEPVYLEHVVAVHESVSLGKPVDNIVRIIINKHKGGEENMSETKIEPIQELNPTVKEDVIQSKEDVKPVAATEVKDALPEGGKVDEESKESKSVVPDVQKPAPTKTNLFPQDNPPNPAPAGYPNDNNQNSSTPSHPPAKTTYQLDDEVLPLHLEFIVDEFFPSKKDEDVEDEGKRSLREDDEGDEESVQYEYDEDKKHFIQKAIKKPGALRASAKRAGVIKGDEPIPVSWLHRMAKRPGKMGKRARLALTLRNLHKESSVESILANKELMAKIVPVVLKSTYESLGNVLKEAKDDGPMPMHGDSDAEPKPEEPMPMHGNDGDADDEAKSKMKKPEDKKEEKQTETQPEASVKETSNLVPLKSGVQPINDNPLPNFKSINEVARYYYELYGNDYDAYNRVRMEILQGKWSHLKN